MHTSRASFYRLWTFDSVVFATKGDLLNQPQWVWHFQHYFFLIIFLNLYHITVSSGFKHEWAVSEFSSTYIHERTTFCFFLNILYFRGKTTKFYKTLCDTIYVIFIESLKTQKNSWLIFSHAAMSLHILPAIATHGKCAWAM